MLPQIFRLHAQKRCSHFTLSFCGFPGPHRRLSYKFSPDAATTQSSKSQTYFSSNVFPTISTHSASRNARRFPNALFTEKMKRASFHSSHRVNLSVQDLPESLIHLKSVEGFAQGFELALLTATPYYPLKHWLGAKKPWIQWASKAIPITIGLGLVAIAMEQCPHTGRWRFLLTEGDGSAVKHETKTEDAKNQHFLSITMFNTVMTQIISWVKKGARQEDEAEIEEEKMAARQHASSVSKQDDLVLDKNDPRVILAERVLDRLLAGAIEAGGEGQLRLKSFLCNPPETPLQIPNEDTLQGVKTLVEKSIDDAVATPKGRRSRRWFQGQKHPFRIYVRNSNVFNAHASNDNIIVLEDGLLRGLAMNEDLIAAVVAHELAHLVQQHQRERGSNASLILLLTAAGIAIFWPAVSVLGPFITYAMFQSLTKGSELLVQRFAFQENEHEADVVAMTILGLAGYDPMNMLAFQLLMAQNEECNVFGLDRVVFSRLGRKSPRTRTLMPILPPESSCVKDDELQLTLGQKRVKRDATVEQDPVLIHNLMIKEYLERPLRTRWSLAHPSHMERKIRCARALCDIRYKWRLSELIKQDEKKAVKIQKTLGQE